VPGGQARDRLLRAGDKLLKIERPDSLIPEQKPGKPLFKDILVKAIKDTKILEDGTGKPVSVSADKAGNIKMASNLDNTQFKGAVEKAVSDYVKAIFNIK
jgi:hypothetical protein